MEEWRDIKGYEGYQVSNLGRVRTHNKVTFTKRHGKREWKDRILKYKGETYKTGYRVDLWKDGKPNSLLVARLVAFTFLNEDINNHNLTVNHIDGDRFNNKIENLELISLADNIRHAFETGLIKTQKPVRISEKATLLCKDYRSLAQGSKELGQCQAYLSHKIANGIFENETHTWELI